MEQEDKSEIADQVSEFRKEALNSTDNIAEISKALKEALDSQSSSIDRAENEIAASSQSEETQASTITGISNSLSELLGVQKEILDSLKGLNKGVDNISQQQGDSLEEGGNAAVDANPIASSSVFSGGSKTGIQLASFDGVGGVGGGGGYYNGNPAGGNEVLNVPEITPLDGGQARQNAEEYLGREMSDEEYNYLIRATNAEAAAGKNADPLEQAGIMASILNRARGEGENGVIEVLNAKNQFQAVTGTRFDPGPSDQFLEGPGEERLSSIENSSQLLSGFGYDQKNFTAADPRAYGPGTNIRYRDNMLESGGTVLGGSVFNTSPNFSSETEGSMVPLSLNWGGELPENITEGSNEITLTDPVSGEEFSVNFEVENVDGNLATVGPVTLAQDTDLEGISGAAGDPVEVSAEMAQDLADQTGASLEPTDLETPATPEGMGGNNNTEMTPEVSTTPVDLEENIIEANASTAERTVASPQQTQTAAADYSEDKPKTVTGGNWHAQVKDYYVMT
jgi:hypothetical protein